jgi:ribosomal protein S27E
MLPIPRHLENILKPIDGNNNEFKVRGKIVCPCRSEKFMIMFVGNDADYQRNNVIKVTKVGENYFLIIKVKCNNCGEEHMIFDNDYHGWNGFVCGGDARGLPRPDTKNWTCNKCSHTCHSLRVKINSQGQEDFIEEGGNELDPNDWVEAFDWFTVDITCNSCGKTNDEWISYETM